MATVVAREMAARGRRMRPVAWVMRAAARVAEAEVRRAAWGGRGGAGAGAREAGGVEGAGEGGGGGGGGGWGKGGCGGVVGGRDGGNRQRSWGLWGVLRGEMVHLGGKNVR